MTEPLRISLARSAADMIAVRELFVEYAAAIQIDLGFQQFDEELVTLPGRYAPPASELLLAFSGEDPAGCVGMRDLGESTAEMKRLFVRPAYRSARLGRQLRLVQYKMSLKGGVIPTQDEPGGNLGKVD